MDRRPLKSPIRLSPFTKQCFVTVGHMLAMSQFGLVMGFTASLLPELRRPDSAIFVDDNVGSWIVAVPYIIAFLTAVFIPILMGKLGRKPSSIISMVLTIVGWLLITVATNITFIIIGRGLHGFSLGIIYCLSPIYIGECTSPKNRGGALTCLSLSLAFGTMASHLMGSYMAWETRSLVCALVCFANLLIMLYCPETPCWLVDKGRYDEGKKAFIWFRGQNDAEELKKMIEADICSKESKKEENFNTPGLSLKNLKRYLRHMKLTAKKPQFYKPIIITMFLNGVVLFSGVNMLAAYADDIFKVIVGNDVDFKFVLASADIQRLITNIIAIYVIKKVKRRTMLIWVGSLNALAYLAIAGYIYGRYLYIFPEKAFVGIILIHLFMFTVALGTVPLPLVIFGEIFPLEYRSISSFISLQLNSPISFLTLKTYPYFLGIIGLHGTFCIYAGILELCLFASWIMVPETKDKTLQEIEYEFKSKVEAGDDEEAKETPTKSLTKCDN